MSQADATVYFDGNTRAVDGAINHVNRGLRGFASSAKGLIGGIFAGIAIHKLFQAGTALVEASNVQEDAVAKVEAVLKSTGNTVGFTSSQLQDMASDLQKVTKYGDEVTLSAQAILLTFKEVRGDQFREATKAAQDMATVLEMDLKGATLQLGKALNDPVRGVSALSRAGVQFTQTQKDMIKSLVESGDIMGAQNVILAELKGQMGGVSEAMAKTTSGDAAQRANRLGDAYERMGDAIKKLGAFMIPVFEKTIDIMEMLGEEVNNLSDDFISFTGGLGIMDYFEEIQKGAVGVMTMFEILFTRTGDVGELAFKTISLAAVTWYEETKHFYTVQMPEYLGWLSRNWREAFIDIFNFTKTVFENMASNVGEFFSSLWAWLSGGEATFEFKALTEGFESSLKELPQIIDRELTDTESALRARVAELGGDIGEDFQKRFKMNLEAAGFGEKEAETPLDFGGAAAADTRGKKLFDAKAIAHNVAGGIKTGIDAISKGQDFFKAAGKIDLDVFDKTENVSPFEDTMSLFNRIRDAAGSSPEAKVNERQAAAAEQLVELFKPVKEGIAKIVTNTKNPALAVLGN